MSEASKMVELALGRLLRIGSRPYQDGDLEQYEMCRRVVMENAPAAAAEYQVSYARDRAKGAQGDA